MKCNKCGSEKVTIYKINGVDVTDCQTCGVSYPAVLISYDVKIGPELWETVKSNAEAINSAKTAHAEYPLHIARIYENYSNGTQKEIIVIDPMDQTKSERVN